MRRPPAGPGPVVLSLPEDMLRETADVADAAPWVQVETHPGLTQMAQLQKMLWAAKQPFVILGGSRWSEAAVAGMRRFAERFDLPVGCSLPPPDALRPRSPELCRRCRHRHQPGAGPARQGGRPPPPHRRAHERDAVVRLHADRHPRAAAGARPRPSRRRGARPRLPADARHQRQPDRLRRRARRPAAAATRSPGAPRRAPPTPPIAPGRRR